MCGIAGLWDRTSAHTEELQCRVEAMAETLRHRGPDDAGTWIDPAVGLAFGHRRLAIVDLSAHGHQPMASPDGRWVVNFNGEIYNFEALRSELRTAGARFEGTSDTEVLIHAVSRWGLLGALERCDGMFALAAWDRNDRVLHLARDRLGEKPLYVGWAGRTLLFGSELRALRAHPHFRGEIDRDAVALFLRYSCVPAPYTIFRGVRKLPPATTVTITPATPPGSLPEPEPYWSLAEAVAAGAPARSAPVGPELADEVEEALTAAVRLRLFADVPVGAFLSGGVDSSLVVALAQTAGPGNVRTFTMGFDDPAFDESTDARKVAAHLGTDHHELPVTPDDALGVIPRLAEVYDEPFADSSQIPTVLLSALTRQHVTVALSGDGGDELFGGYNRHVFLTRVWPAVSRLPAAGRAAVAGTLGRVPTAIWERSLGPDRRGLPRLLRMRLPAMKAAKTAAVLGAPDATVAYERLVSHTVDPATLVRGGSEPRGWPAQAPQVALGPGELAMFLDTVGYLPDDILTKVDRASMAASLEMRVPFLDHRLVELAWRLPLDAKVHGWSGKHVLRQVLHRHVPAPLVDRPKAGFGVPLAAWLRGPLRSWAAELLDPSELERHDLLDPAPVRRMWEQHLCARRDCSYQLWDVLMLQSWLAGPGSSSS